MRKMTDRFLTPMRTHHNHSKKNSVFNSTGQKWLVNGYRLLSKHVDLQSGIPGAAAWLLYYSYKWLTEGRSLRRVLEWVKPDSLVLDIGANVGFFSIFASRYTQANVIAFEPEPKNYRQLCGAVEANRLNGRIHPHRLAITDRSGQVDFFLSELSPMDHKLIDSRSAQRISVPATSIDDFFSSEIRESRRSISLIKIDVQGSELSVLAGMRNTLAEHGYPPIFVEFAPDDLAAASVEPQSFLDAFAALNYTPRDPSTRKPIAPETLLALQSAYTDLLMINVSDDIEALSDTEQRSGGSNEFQPKNRK